MAITKPSVAEVNKYLKKWAGLTHYVEQDKAIYLLFKTFPKNDKLGEVISKACCVNGFYSTNIYDIYTISQHIIDLKIDKRLAKNDLTVVNDIAKCKMKNGKIKEFYSFATKYCSHCKDDVYPIYDSFVDKMLCELNKLYSFSTFKKADLKDYVKFCGVLNDLKKHFGLGKFTLKEIDMYLWQAGKDYFSKPYKKTTSKTKATI